LKGGTPDSGSRVNRRFFIRTLGSLGAIPLLLPVSAGAAAAAATHDPTPVPDPAVTPRAGSQPEGAGSAPGSMQGDPSPARGDPSPARTKKSFETVEHEVDFCVVGGGMAGLCAAIAAARRGARVVLMQDRPVLGGNASSEIRMHICGARGADNKEAGILEEIMLENCRRNPSLKYPIWDTVLYEKARFQENLTLLLNCTCNEVEAGGGRGGAGSGNEVEAKGGRGESAVKGRRIASVLGWQLTSQTWHRVRARLFADCSGDSVLRVSGAEFRRGREARREFGEASALPAADDKTMGSSILIQIREVGEHVPFVPPAWAHKYKDGDLPNRDLRPAGNFWWLEIGGEQDTIADAEEIRDELLKIAFGVWDFIKNHPDGRGYGWELEWIGALPGKRENIRYVGDHTLTLVAYGGWPMDDHPPAAIEHKGKPTTYYPAPSPYGIPYRCLYSRNVENLLFAGRNISATHLGLSSTRVMATCALMGQAAGTAAAIAVRHGLSPRGVYEEKVAELQQAIMDDDGYLPWKRRPIPAICREAKLSASAGDPEPLRNGVDRTLGEEDNGWWGAPEAWVEYRFDRPQKLTRARFVFDSYLPFDKRIPSSFPMKGNKAPFPKRLCRDFDLAVPDGSGGWRVAVEVRDSCRRLVKVQLDVTTKVVRFIPRRTWGWDEAHVFAFDVS